jgi:hypothetical protein
LREIFDSFTVPIGLGVIPGIRLARRAKKNRTKSHGRCPSEFGAASVAYVHAGRGVEAQSLENRPVHPGVRFSPPHVARANRAIDEIGVGKVRPDVKDLGCAITEKTDLETLIT